MDSVRHYFERQAEAYSTLRESFGLWGIWKRREAEAVRSVIPSCEGLHVLDVGSGTGYFSHVLLELGAASVTALDHSPKMLARIPDHQGVKKILWDLNQGVPQGREFDLALCLGVLEFLESPRSFLTSLEQVCRSIVFLTPAPRVFSLYRSFHKRNGISLNQFGLDRFGTERGWCKKDEMSVFPMSRVSRWEI